MKRLLFISVLIFLSTAIHAQTTKVRGKVLDAYTGEPVPYAGVFFKGTTTGMTCDTNGEFSLEIRNPEAKVLVCQLIGYEYAETAVSPGVFNNIDFFLRPSENRIEKAVVRADDSKARALLANIDRNRERNDPEKLMDYNCNIYNKMELDLTNPREQIKGKRFLKEFGFVFDYIDTSTVSGSPYLPLMISESVSKRRHTINPDIDDETIVANRISGIKKDFNLLSQFTGNMLLKINFYKPFINSFGAEMPSPIQKNGIIFYNYFIVDSLDISGRRTLLVHFHPKEGISTPAFDGEMQIDAEDFALRSIKARMKHSGNVNWIKDLVLETEYEKRSDSIWFYKTDKLYSEFSLSVADSSDVLSVIGTRELTYSDIEFKRPDKSKTYNGSVRVSSDANFKDDRYWNEARPYELSEKEQNIYRMVDEIQDTPLYHNVYTLIYTLATGYLDFGPVGVGRVLRLVSFNNLEGCRPQLCLHTSKDLTNKFRFTVYGAYGTRDKEWKGGLSFERMFRRDMTRKLTLDAHYDVLQLGKGNSEFTTGNILSSFWSGSQRPCTESSFSAVYDHEFSSDFNLQAGINARRIFSNPFIPITDSSGNPLGSVATNEIHLQGRFSHEEIVNRGHFTKTYANSLHPVWTIDLTGSVPGLREGDCGYFRPELTMNWKMKLPPVGISRLKVNAGTVLGKVPYPLLHLHEGNATALQDRTAFSCMDYLEFVSDTWVTVFWSHNFEGFLLGKIPGIRKLNLRENVAAKTTWGRLGENVILPDGCSPLGDVPYVELSAGISNIFRLFRVDCNWRLTHRDSSRRLFAVTFGLELQF